MIRRCFLLTAALALSFSQSTAETQPRIAIIIDDLGYQLEAGRRAIQLPGPVAFAILPGTPHSRRLAAFANDRGKEVLLHLPLEAVDYQGPSEPGGMTLDMTHGAFKATFAEAMATVPFAVGVSSHRGSLLTRHPGHMAWLMQEIGAREDLFFIDSFTTHESVALRVATEAGITATRRDVFLDHERSVEAVTRELERLKTLARKRGQAVAIGHPFPETLEVLEKALPGLEEQGFELVTIGELLRDEWNRI
jgi:polysaccharide deacetylase 2 family uncharacterized protein YibQ